MGNCSALVSPAEEESIHQNKWRERLTKRQARQKFIADGSLPKGSSDDMLEFRAFLEEPILVEQYGRYVKSKDVKCLQLLVCSVEILEYKNIRANTADYKVQAFETIYRKYFLEYDGSNFILPYVSVFNEYVDQLRTTANKAGINTLPSLSLGSLNDSLGPEPDDPTEQQEVATAKDRNHSIIGPLLSSDVMKFHKKDKKGDAQNRLLKTSSYVPPPNAFDNLLHQCLSAVYRRSFCNYKDTDAFRRYCRVLSKGFNQVCVDDFEFLEALGAGAFGFVVHCVKKSTQKHYAMKIQSKVGLLDSFYDSPDRVVQEKEAVTSIHHPFIINVDYAFQTRAMIMIVMDLGTGMSSVFIHFIDYNNLHFSVYC